MSVNIHTTVAESINYAAAHLGMQKIVGDIVLESADTNQLVCRISSVPEFIYEYKQTITVVGESQSISSPALKINDSFYRREILEAQEGEIKIEVFQPDEPEKILGFLNTSVHVQPYLHWDGANYPEAMPGFMQPNDPLILQVLKAAGEYAAAEGNSMCGYQCRNSEGVKKQAEYIYRALQDTDIHYLSAPASFERFGQKIRIPRQVLHEESRQGTCLDLAILFATCLEAVSLNAVVVVIPGHAFAGVWSLGQAFSKTRVVPDQIDSTLWSEAVSKIIPVECTFITDGKNISFQSAMDTGRKNMEQCRYLIDVATARKEGIVPVYTYTDKPICGEVQEEKNRFLRREFSKEKKSKLDHLRDQAMDITGKSHLLNSGAEKLSIDFQIETEDFLMGKVSDADITERLTISGSRKTKNSNILRELYSKSRQNLRESGKSNLFISINELRWKTDVNGKPYNAVMYLCPVEIYRNGRGDFQLRFNTEDIFFNPALKVLLEQGYHLDSRKLKESPGEDYKAQMELLHFLIEHQRGWVLKENVAHLSMYSIPNEAVWNGLKDENVLSHEIVSGILAGRMDWENQISKDEKKDGIEGIYAFETDSSQSEIIEAAFERKAQLVVGPAGNGKTQTVVNIMLEAVRRGERVLFVSEMAPAMEVAYEKLNQILEGLFNLKIIHGKNHPSDVVAQLRKTLDYIENPRYRWVSDDVKVARQRYREYLSDVKQYYALMKRKNLCGKSLEELIEMYEQYKNCTLNLNLDEVISSAPLAESEDHIRILSKIMEEYDRAKGEFSAYVRYDNLAGKEEMITLELAEKALNCYESLLDSAYELKEILGITVQMSEKSMLQEMILIAKQLRKCPVYHKSIGELMGEPESEESTFIQNLIVELKKLSGRRPAWLKTHQKEKCFNLLRKLYSADETRNILDDFETNPQEVLAKIGKLKVFLDEDGEITGGDSESRGQFSVYMKRTEEIFQNEPGQIKKAVVKGIEEIVSGNGRKLKEAAYKTDDCYKRYRQAHEPAENRIIRNAGDFSRQYPELPQKVLFEEWIENRKIDTNRSRSLYDGIVADMERIGYGGLIRQIEEAREKTAVTGEEILKGFYKAWALYHINKLQEEFSENYKFNSIVFQDKVQSMICNENIIRKNLKSEINQIQLSHVPNIEEGVSNNLEFGILQTLIRRKNIAIRTFFEQAPNVLGTIFPCMIMDPLAAAEYIPSVFPKFDLVLIDEGSQMPAYNALIPISRAKRCIIFGDEKQLQPSDEFKKRLWDENEMTIERESILTAAYITSMPRKMLRFHYRSEKEGLIAFSNKYYYNGDIITFPSCDTSFHGISYEAVKDGIYDKEGSKANLLEAKRVIQYIRELYEKLPEGTMQTLGVITLNIHQRDLIQSLLLDEVQGDTSLGMKIDELVSVVNLESCQGKEWDYVVISPGFGNDTQGKLVSGFGALNKEYGPNRLNVMLTRARKKMHVITSIEPYMLTGVKSRGVQNFKEFLQYAKGDIILDSRIYDRDSRPTGLANNIAAALEEAGYQVHTNIGSSDFKVDIGVVSKGNPDKYCLGILLDHFRDPRSTIHDREATYPKILESKGWKIYKLRELNWNQNPSGEIRRIIKAMEEK